MRGPFPSARMISVIVLFYVFACTTVEKAEDKVLKAKEAPDSGFTQDSDQMKHDEDLPFNAVWYDHKVDWKQFHSIQIAPVNTHYLERMSWWDAVSFANLTESERQHSVQKVAQYMRDRVSKAFADDPHDRLTVTDSTGPDTVVLEMALVELVPTKAWQNTITMLVIGAWSHGVVAMEARVREGSSGKVIVAFKDREFGKTAAISAADYTWYMHSTDIIDDWANEMVEIINAEPDERVKAASPLNFRPW